MLHFPSTTGSSNANLPRRTDSLNATQHKASSDPIFLKIEEELHDARRVHTHGQEDDLRYALNMVIDRVSQLSQMLTEAYKTQADLEVQLNVAKSNLQLVISNNEMLEDALRRDTSGSSKDVGWRRRTGRESLEKSQSADLDAPVTPVSATASPVPSTAAQDNRFFKFRFNSSSNSAAPSKPASRPSTPNGTGTGAGAGTAAYHLTSPSMPTLPSQQQEKEKEKAKEKEKEREEEKKKLNMELEEVNKKLKKELEAKKAIAEEKAQLEGELESLSQALFEEANKMVATERMKRAETEEELKQLQLEKEALRSALKVIEGENRSLRNYTSHSSEHLPDSNSRSRSSSTTGIKTRSRSSSITGVKSRPGSETLSLPPLPPSPAPGSPTEEAVTPRYPYPIE
ncbi:hypothetical protein BDQ17DRAFT_1333859 [Cyathus striatus]|nr:hypothetical protein BDQ17DRAFT_1333859 [Cyathus striatus]